MGFVRLAHYIYKVALPALLLAACQPSAEEYHTFLRTPDKGWTRRDTLSYKLPLQKNDIPCQIDVELRHSSMYPYRSIWLLVAHNEQDSTAFRTDTIECVLTDEAGLFDGAGVNDLYQKRFPLMRTNLKAKTSPTFKITHYMKDKRIKGIQDVGIRVYAMP